MEKRQVATMSLCKLNGFRPESIQSLYAALWPSCTFILFPGSRTPMSIQDVHNIKHEAAKERSDLEDVTSASCHYCSFQNSKDQQNAISFRLKGTMRPKLY